MYSAFIIIHQWRVSSLFSLASCYEQNMDELVSLWLDMESFGVCAQEWHRGSNGRSVSRFWRSVQTRLHTGCTSSHSYPRCMGIPSLHPQQCLLPFVLRMTAVLTGERWNFKVVLIRISLVAKDVGDFFYETFQPFVFPLMRILCSDSWPIF